MSERIAHSRIGRYRRSSKKFTRLASHSRDMRIQMRVDAQNHLAVSDLILTGIGEAALAPGVPRASPGSPSSRARFASAENAYACRP
jgi:hypothetical protein